MNDYVALLRELIRTPSLSREESATAEILSRFISERGHVVERLGNNIVVRHHAGGANAPWLLLNSHHDTVRAGQGWTRDPLGAEIVDGVLYGLGSNDAGGPLMAMLATYMHLTQYEQLPYNVMFAATAEEEVSGQDGMAMLAREGVLNSVTLAMVGEPTRMQMAVAERGLIVLDVVAEGRTGHAARNEGINAIYMAMQDIEWFRTYAFDRVSSVLGPVSMTVTQIEAGSQHNVVPDRCSLVVDVRVTDADTNVEVVDIIRQHVRSTVTPRSMRLRPSSTPLDHPLVQVAASMGMECYGSPTMSDQSLLPDHIHSVKIGPGNSARSHTPDEYITLQELESGIGTMIALAERFLGVGHEALG
jgi:acetylornithine deacetylase